MTHDELLLEVQRLRLLKAEHERQIETLLGMLDEPDGFVLAPIKATPIICEALRTGSRRDVPSDALCEIRWAAALASVCRIPTTGASTTASTTDSAEACGTQRG